MLTSTLSTDANHKRRSPDFPKLMQSKFNHRWVYLMRSETEGTLVSSADGTRNGDHFYRLNEQELKDVEPGTSVTLTQED